MDMEYWIYDSLSQILGGELAEDLTKYILSIDSEADLEEYMKDLLDFSDKSQRELFENIKSAKFSNRKASRINKRESNGGGPSNGDFINLKTVLDQDAASEASSTSGKKKSKQPKYSKYQLHEIQQGYLKEGRMPCECQATKHKLINNCIECGRIVCEQEGSGPCFFCDNMVCTPEEMQVLNLNTKESDALYNALTNQKKSDTWKKAMQHRNKLLDSDQNFVKVNKIIDDESDYFEVTNTWATKKQRELSAKKLKQEHEEKYGSRLGSRKFTIDLDSKTTLEDKEIRNYEVEEYIEDSIDKRKSDRATIPDIDSVLAYFDRMKIETKSNKPGLVKKTDKTSQADFLKNYVIQDKTYLEMRDMGMCLSMHQPWASLLVTGIKQHEGRSWYTPHRGPLWIAAAAKPAEPEEIQTCEEFYKDYYNGETVVFPSEYPTGCLIGRVLVQECMNQKDYREEFPNGESNSPYVLICSDPQVIPVGFPMQGDHKIFKLKSDIFKMARDALIIRRRCLQ